MQRCCIKGFGLSFVTTICLISMILSFPDERIMIIIYSSTALISNYNNVFNNDDIPHYPNMAHHRFSLDISNRRRRPCCLVSVPVHPSCKLIIAGQT
jgi:hypothetical protein